MNSFLELLQQAQKELVCPSCGRKFQLAEIRPRGRVKNSIMLQAVCANNHFPVVLIFIPSQPVKLTIKAIAKKEIVQMADALKEFNGDFMALWKK